MKNVSYDKKLSRTIMTFAVAICPFLRVYKSFIPGIDLGEFFLIIALFVCVINNQSFFPPWKRVKSVWTLVLLFAVITLIDLLIQDCNFSDILFLFLRWLFYVYIITSAVDYVDKKLLVDLFHILGIVACLGLVAQIIGYYIFGTNWTLKISFLQLNLAENYTGVFIKSINGLSSLRATSFFSEPAHFAYYICVSLVVELFFGEKNKMLVAVLFSMCIIASTSTGGIVFLVIIWLYYLVVNARISLTRRLLVVLVAIIVSFVLFNYTSAGEYALLKLLQFFSSNGESSLRTNTYRYLSYFNSIDKVLGVGFGNSEYYLNNVLGIGYIYAASLVNVIMWTGYVGLIGLLWCLAVLFFNAQKPAKPFVVLFLVSLLFTQMLTSLYICIFLIWPVIFSRNNCKNNNASGVVKK